MADRRAVDPVSARQALLREVYDVFVRGDLEWIEANIDPRFEYHNPDYAIDPGVRHGPAGLRHVLEGLHELFDYYEVETEEIERIGSRHVIMFRVKGQGKASGVPIDQTFAHVWTFDDAGRAIRLQWFRAREEGLAAARTPE